MYNNQIQNWIIPEPITIPSVCTLVEAYRLMVDHRTSRLLVVDNGVLVGVVTLEDLRRKLPDSLGFFSANPGSQYDDWIPVSLVMRKNPQTIQADSSLIQAAHILLDTQVPDLPVMDGDRVVGIITESDILRALLVQIEA